MEHFLEHFWNIFVCMAYWHMFGVCWRGCELWNNSSRAWPQDNPHWFPHNAQSTIRTQITTTMLHKSQSQCCTNHDDSIVKSWLQCCLNHNDNNVQINHPNLSKNHNKFFAKITMFYKSQSQRSTNHNHNAQLNHYDKQICIDIVYDIKSMVYSV